MRNLDFYSTSATLFPLLFLALLFENRASDRVNDGVRQQADVLRVLTFVGFSVLGEGFALHVLDVGHATKGDRWIVIEALAVTSITVVIQALKLSLPLKIVRIALLAFIAVMLYLSVRAFLF